jgi:endonuclease-8
MPEGPEMRRAADALDKVLRGEQIRHAWFKFPRLAEAARRFEGQRVDGVEARGKALIVCFEDGSAVYTHNQLYGKWLVGPTGQRPDTTRDLRFALETDRHAALLYSASDIELLRTDELGQHPYISRLGVELLARGTTVDAVLAQVEDPRFARRPLGALLLDQGFLAGVGNYLRSEILFVSGLHPDAKPATLGAAQRRRLAQAALSITRRAYRTGGITSSPSLAARLRREGVSRGQYRHFVFARQGTDCHRCGTPDSVHRIVHGGRQLYLCSVCQPASYAAEAP